MDFFRFWIWFRVLLLHPLHPVPQLPLPSCPPPLPGGWLWAEDWRLDRKAGMGPGCEPEPDGWEYLDPSATRVSSDEPGAGVAWDPLGQGQGSGAGVV